MIEPSKEIQRAYRSHLDEEILRQVRGEPGAGRDIDHLDFTEAMCRGHGHGGEEPVVDLEIVIVEDAGREPDGHVLAWIYRHAKPVDRGSATRHRGFDRQTAEVEHGLWHY